MPSDHNSNVEEASNRIIDWLLQHRAEFEQTGIEESSLAADVGLTEEEVRKAVDHLEAHEDVARVPEALSDPPRFLLKPARGWHEIVESRPAGKQASTKI
jgi:hypothetical protein